VEKVAGSRQTGRTGKTTTGQRSGFVWEEPLVSKRQGVQPPAKERDIKYCERRLREIADEHGVLPSSEYGELQRISTALKVFHGEEYMKFVKRLGLVPRIEALKDLAYIERRIREFSHDGIAPDEGDERIHDVVWALPRYHGTRYGAFVKGIGLERRVGREEQREMKQREERRARFTLEKIEEMVRGMMDAEGKVPNPEDVRITAMDIALQLYHGMRYADFVKMKMPGIQFAEPAPLKSLVSRIVG